MFIVSSYIPCILKSQTLSANTFCSVHLGSNHQKLMITNIFGYYGTKIANPEKLKSQDYCPGYCGMYPPHSHYMYTTSIVLDPPFYGA